MRSEADTDGNELSSFTQHHPIHSAAFGTHGHANADLACSLAHGIGNDAVEADDAEQQRHHGKSANDPRRRTMQIG